MDYNKRYIIGPVAKLEELFPNYSGNDARYSLDGKQVIYEVNLSEEDLAQVKKKTSVKVFVHADVIAFLNAPSSEGVWFEKQDQSAAETAEAPAEEDPEETEGT